MIYFTPSMFDSLTIFMLSILMIGLVMLMCTLPRINKQFLIDNNGNSSMSRSTTFVGLNSKAENFVSQMTKIQDATMFSEGLCGEILPLYKYTDVDGNEFLEYEQVSPWAGGPWIFTCLIHRKNAAGDELNNALFLWQTDPNIDAPGFDRRSGTFNV